MCQLLYHCLNKSILAVNKEGKRLVAAFYTAYISLLLQFIKNFCLSRSFLILADIGMDYRTARTKLQNPIDIRLICQWDLFLFNEKTRSQINDCSFFMNVGELYICLRYRYFLFTCRLYCPSCWNTMNTTYVPLCSTIFDKRT